MSQLTGRTLDRYELLEQIGQGGMASVYRAQDLAQDRTVALKILMPGVGYEEQFRQRFRREAGVVLQLRHPNIVSVENFGEQNGYTYLVMPYLRGGSLIELFKRGSLTLEAVARVAGEIAGALDYAHGRGVVHRDVKPQNILIDDQGNAQLADFGLARLHDTSVSLTGSALLGTPAYCSPEQARGSKVDHRSDQYSLGVILFQLLTGRLPFDADTPMAVLLKQISEPFPSPRSISPDIPDTVERVILKATAKNPDYRFRSISDMNEALQASVAHHTDPRSPKPKIDLIAEEPTASVPSSRDRPKRPLRWGFIGVLIALVLLAAPVAYTTLRGSREPATIPTDGSGRLPPGMELIEGAAVAATLQAIPTVTPASPALADQGSGNMPKTGSFPASVRSSEPCAGTSLGAFSVSGKTAFWTLKNGNPESTAVEEIHVAWPAVNGGLFKIHLGSNLIWQGSAPASPTSIRLGKENAYREVAASSEVELSIQFKEPAQPTGYSLFVLTDGGCSAAAEH